MKNYQGTLWVRLATLLLLIGQTALAQEGYNSTETVNCGTDTIAYPLAKAATQESTLLIKDNHEGIAQWYELPSAASIHGISFPAGVVTAGPTNKTATLTVSVYASSPDSLPAGPPLVVTTVGIDTTYQLHQAAFLAGLPISTDFIVAVEYGNGLTDNDTVAIGVNGSGDGDGENLGAILMHSGSGDTWLKFEQTLSMPDRDALLYPWLEYSLTTDFAMGGDTLCVDEPLTFLNASTPIASHRMYNQRVRDAATHGDAFSWSFGDGGTAATESPAHTYTATGSYSVLLTTSVTGYGTSCAEPMVRQLAIEDRPTAAFAASDSTVSVGDTVWFTNMSTGSASCSWNFGDGTDTTGCSDQMHVFDSMGTYTVMLEVTSPYGCTELHSISIDVDGPTAVQPGIRAEDFTIFPNPAQDVLRVRIAGDLSGTEGQLTILDLSGKTVLQRSIPTGATTPVWIAELPTGVYLARFSNATGTSTKKLLKQ